MNEQKKYPQCPPNCRAAHTIKTAMFLLGIGRTKLYALMNGNQLAYVDKGYGRRICHDEIDRYLGRIANSANTGEQLRTDSAA